MYEGIISRNAISIHAPLRERRNSKHNVAAVTAFQSTLPCGSDRELLAPHSELLLFQSTLPCGSDPVSSCFVCTTSYFNPRSLAGATHNFIVGNLKGKISIHAPLRERPLINTFGLPVANFNPRSLAGATLLPLVW